MDLTAVMQELESYGNPATKKTLMKHGAQEPFFGVKVQDLKKILKKTKKNHELALALYDTGNTDAMYLAGLMADETKMTKQQLEAWVQQAYWSYLSEYTVPWVAAETPYGFDLGLKWRKDKQENVASAGWATLAYYSSVREDETLDLMTYEKLLLEVVDNIPKAPNRVKYVMNGFVIAIGTYIKALTAKATMAAEQIGKVSVEMNGTACKVPLATDYIQKVITKNKVGVKRKTARC